MKNFFGMIFILLGFLCLLLLISKWLDFNFKLNTYTEFLIRNSKIIILMVGWFIGGVFIIFKKER